MRRGRKKTPSILNLIRGNPSKRPMNPFEPQPPNDIGEPPSMLEGEALAEWQRLGPQLEAIGVLTEVDVPAFAAYCKQWARYKEAEAKVAQLGEVVKAPSGYPIINPYLSIANKAYKQCREFWDQFGMTASARTKIAVKPRAATDAASPLSKYLKHG